MTWTWAFIFHKHSRAALNSMLNNTFHSRELPHQSSGTKWACPCLLFRNWSYSWIPFVTVKKSWNGKRHTMRTAKLVRWSEAQDTPLLSHDVIWSPVWLQIWFFSSQYTQYGVRCLSTPWHSGGLYFTNKHMVNGHLDILPKMVLNRRCIAICGIITVLSPSEFSCAGD